MDLATFQRITGIGAILFFPMALVGLVGEILGWWNDTGEVLMIVGTSSGLLLSVAMFAACSSMRQVTGVAQGVERANPSLDEANRSLGETNSSLGRMDRKLDEQTVVLREIRDRL